MSEVLTFVLPFSFLASSFLRFLCSDFFLSLVFGLFLDLGLDLDLGPILSLLYLVLLSVGYYRLCLDLDSLLEF